MVNLIWANGDALIPKGLGAENTTVQKYSRGVGLCGGANLIDRPGYTIRVVPQGVVNVLRSDADYYRRLSSEWMFYETKPAASFLKETSNKDAITAGMECDGLRQSLKSYFINSLVSKCSKMCSKLPSLRI